MSKKVTEKNTKAEILAAYNAKCAEVDATKVQSTATVVEQKRVSAVTEKATATVGSVDSIKTAVEKALGVLTDLTDQANNLDEAIKIKKDEIKDIHDFEYNANSVAAIIMAKDQLVADKTAEAENIISAAKTQASEIISAANEKVSETKTAQARQEEEWKYNFGIQKRNATDALDQEINARKAEMKIAEDTVIARETAVTKREDAMDAIEKELAEVKANTAAEIEKAVEAAVDAVNKSNATSKAFSDRAHKQDLEMKDVKIAALEEKVVELTKQLADANVIISAANASVADMAKSALGAQADRETVAKLSEIVAQNAGGKK